MRKLAILNQIESIFELHPPRRTKEENDEKQAQKSNFLAN